MRKGAEMALKDLDAQEKLDVGVQERLKHARTKQKKLKKSVQDVG